MEGRALSRLTIPDDTAVVPPPSPADEQSQELRVGKFPAGSVSDRDQIHRRNHVESLISGADARHDVARRRATQHRATPTLPLPFPNQHRFDIELAATGRVSIIPPA